MEIEKKIINKLYREYYDNLDDHEIVNYSNAYNDLLDNSELFQDIIIGMTQYPFQQPYEFKLSTMHGSAAFCKAVLTTVKTCNLEELDVSGRIKAAIHNIHEPLERYRTFKTKEREV